MHDRLVSDLPLAILNHQIVTATTPPEGAAGPVTPSKDALTLWVRDDKGQTQPLRVPLVEASALDRQLGLQFQTGLPAEMRHHLQQNGYDVESRQRYAPLWLENGRPLVLPVEDTKIVPVNERVY
jgi:hypothetical protein